jgi:hypothetical protein
MSDWTHFFNMAYNASAGTMSLEDMQLEATAAYAQSLRMSGKPVPDEVTEGEKIAKERRKEREKSRSAPTPPPRPSPNQSQPAKAAKKTRK